jgi:hypothetical protein
MVRVVTNLEPCFLAFQVPSKINSILAVDQISNNRLLDKEE